MISREAQEYFSTPRQAQISLPSHGLIPTQLPCLLSFTAPKHLQAHFPERVDPLASQDLDLEGVVFCFCSGPEMIYHFYARIEALSGERQLRLVVTEATAYPQRRRFFRVDAEVILKCWPAGKEREYICEAESKKVNLSAVGLRFETNHFLKHGQEINMELQLPGEDFEPVRCNGRVVRISFTEDNQIENVAVDLVRILPEEQEKLIKFCLAEQRRQIRLKVRVLDGGG